MALWAGRCKSCVRVGAVAGLNLRGDRMGHSSRPHRAGTVPLWREACDELIITHTRSKLWTDQGEFLSQTD